MARNLIFDSAGIDAVDAYAEYERLFSQFVGIERTDEPFAARLAAAPIGRYTLYHARLCGVRHLYGPQSAVMARAALVAPTQGRIAWKDETGIHKVEPSTTVVWDFERLISVDFQSAELLFLAFHPADLPPVSHSIVRLHGQVQSGSITAIIQDVLASMVRHAPDLDGMERNCCRVLDDVLAMATSSAENDNRKERIAERLLSIVQENPAARITASSLCRDLGVSRASLFRILKPYGRLSDLVLLGRVTTAARMMREDPTRSLKDVGAAVGLGDEQALNRAFRIVHGMDASVFQERLRPGSKTLQKDPDVWRRLVLRRATPANRLKN